MPGPSVFGSAPGRTCSRRFCGGSKKKINFGTFTLEPQMSARVTLSIESPVLPDLRVASNGDESEEWLWRLCFFAFLLPKNLTRDYAAPVGKRAGRCTSCSGGESGRSAAAMQQKRLATGYKDSTRRR